MNEQDAEEYTQALAQSFSGNWRQLLLAEKLGVPKKLGMTMSEWVAERIGGYTRRSIEDRRAAVLEAKGEGLSNRAIARVLGVDEITVRRDLKPATNVAPEPGAEPTDQQEPKEPEEPATNVAPEPDEAEPEAPTEPSTELAIPDDAEVVEAEIVGDLPAKPHLTDTSPSPTIAKRAWDGLHKANGDLLLVRELLKHGHGPDPANEMTLRTFVNIAQDILSILEAAANEQ